MWRSDHDMRRPSRIRGVLNRIRGFLFTFVPCISNIKTLGVFNVTLILFRVDATSNVL